MRDSGIKNFFSIDNKTYFCGEKHGNNLLFLSYFFIIISMLSEGFVLVLFTDGWINYQSSFYFISSEWKSWTESRRYCTEKRADLIIINNGEEQEFIQKISGGAGVWIGLTDSDVEGRWKWYGLYHFNGECEDKSSRPCRWTEPQMPSGALFLNYMH
uniref:C-type lectin domain-containing protein n=1 Tax=Sinocyclocheilus rhinocerous TaxID=307959 RepID=A0A673K7S0_9TELE